MSNRGFTLIEVLTVIGILAILGTVIMYTLDPISQYRKAQDSRRKSDLAQVKRVLEAYYQDYGQYPEYDESNFTILDSDGNEVAWGEPWKPYTDLLPIDPNSDKYYLYWSDDSNNNQSYRLYTSLDRGGDDPDACNETGVNCAGLPDEANCNMGATGKCNCGQNEEPCSYGVTSPNVSP